MQDTNVYYTLAALVVGITMSLSNYCFFASMLAFYFAGSRATKIKAAEKQKYSADYKEGIAFIVLHAILRQIL